MKLLWAPWRIKYIRANKEKECFLCKKIKDTKEKDKTNFILERGKYCFVIMNTYPYNNGHILVSPNRHIFSLKELTNNEKIELFNLCSKWIEIIKIALNAEGFNIGINLEKVAGAGLPGHLHIHIVPRWIGDTNFMPSIAETKVISESLEDTYSKLLNVYKTEHYEK